MFIVIYNYNLFSWWFIGCPWITRCISCVL